MQRVARNAERSCREGKAHADRTRRIRHSGRSHGDRAADRCTGNSRWQSRQEQQELGGRRPGSSRDEVGGNQDLGAGRISEVPVNANDKVLAGEPLLRLDDEEARARTAMAQAQVTMRKRARNDQAAGKAADRRKAEDAVSDAEATLVEARDAFDKVALQSGPVAAPTSTLPQRARHGKTRRMVWTSSGHSCASWRPNPKHLCRPRAKANSTSHVPSLGSQLWSLKG
jgi:Biotin-lipoyl like